MKTSRHSLALVATLSLAFVCVAQQPPEGRERPGGPGGLGGPGAQGGPGGGRGGRGGMMRAMPLMMALDADKDGEISAAEIENASKALKALDKNGDGKLSPDELRPAMPEGAEGGPGRQVGGPGQNVDRLMAMDKNGDGKLSKDELPERMQAIFADADTDKDGFLSKAELTARMAQPGAGGPGGGRQRREGGEGRPRE